MKRKTIIDYYTPLKKLKESSTQLSIPNPSPIPTTPPPLHNPEKSLPSAISLIMSTRQCSLKSNFHLSYNGKINLKHSWSYSFDSSDSFIYKSTPHKLKQSSKDPCEILLTFSTSHKGQRLHFFGFPPKPSLSPSILKSILHKAIRRKNRNSSIKTSLQLACNCGIQELARRLCVIELEDTFLHPDMPLLVWCMGVSDFEYSLEILESILQIVSDLSCVEYQDIWTKENDVNLFEVWKKGKVLVKAILIRTFYRGMAGDVKMLTDYASIWNRRLEDCRWSEIIRELYENLQIWRQDDVEGGYGFEDAIAEGIDFHCSNVIDVLAEDEEVADKIKQRGEEDVKGYLKSAIWNYRSRLNLRPYINQHPLAKSLCQDFTPEIIKDDPFFQRTILPLVDAYSVSELKRRFKLI